MKGIGGCSLRGGVTKAIFLVPSVRSSSSGGKDGHGRPNDGRHGGQTHGDGMGRRTIVIGRRIVDAVQQVDGLRFDARHVPFGGVPTRFDQQVAQKVGGTNVQQISNEVPIGVRQPSPTGGRCQRRPGPEQVRRVGSRSTVVGLDLAPCSIGGEADGTLHRSRGPSLVVGPVRQDHIVHQGMNDMTQFGIAFRTTSFPPPTRLIDEGFDDGTMRDVVLVLEDAGQGPFGTVSGSGCAIDVVPTRVGVAGGTSCLVSDARKVVFRGGRHLWLDALIDELFGQNDVPPARVGGLDVTTIGQIPKVVDHQVFRRPSPPTVVQTLFQQRSGIVSQKVNVAGRHAGRIRYRRFFTATPETIVRQMQYLVVEAAIEHPLEETKGRRGML